MAKEKENSNQSDDSEVEYIRIQVHPGTLAQCNNCGIKYVNVQIVKPPEQKYESDYGVRVFHFTHCPNCETEMIQAPENPDVKEL